MNKSILLLLACFSLLNSSLSAQADDDTSAKNRKSKLGERLVFGGEVVVSFSNQGSILGASPLIGYRVSDRYVAGVGITYLYYSYPLFTANNYGARVFNRFSVTDEFFLHGEFEYGTFVQKSKRAGDNFTYKGSYPALLVGAGYRQSVGGTLNVGFSILYDVLQDPNSPYGDQLIYRGGMTIGF